MATPKFVPTAMPTGLSDNLPASSGTATDLPTVRARLRREGLDRAALVDDPIDQFRQWRADWAATGPYDPDAAVLATADAEGRPSARWVDVADVDHGFVFLTDHGSRKALDLAVNPRAGLTFGWLEMERQVRVDGTVTRLTDVESDVLFARLPRPVQLLVWATRQSSALPDPEELRSARRKAERRFAGQEVPRGRHWGGYRLVPDEVEFWQGRLDGVQDRFRYLRTADEPGWRIERLAP
jgi:pyridoxamine 5'-phosphate oxidase